MFFLFFVVTLSCNSLKEILHIVWAVVHQFSSSRTDIAEIHVNHVRMSPLYLQREQVLFHGDSHVAMFLWQPRMDTPNTDFKEDLSCFLQVLQPS